MAMAPQLRAGRAREQDAKIMGRSPAAATVLTPARPLAALPPTGEKWEPPYSGPVDDDYAMHTVLIVAAVLFATCLAMAIISDLCWLLGCILRARRRRAGISHPERPAVEAPPPEPDLLVYSAEASTKLAGAAAECVICLGEFADGDAVRVMPACRHGFHELCIERWLATDRRSSCPTCRAPAAAATGAAAAAQP